MPLAALHFIPFLFLSLSLAGSMAGIGGSFAAALFLPVPFLLLDSLSARPTRAVSGQPIVYQLVPWLYIPLQLGVVTYAGGLAANAGAWRLTGLALAVGLTTGIFGVLTAHELIHSRWRGDQVLGLIFYAAMTYPHFRLSHIEGHHRLAATPDDPASARRGENVYRFLIRSVAGQFRFARKVGGVSGKRGWTLSGVAVSRMAGYGLLTLLIYTGFAAAFGFRGIVFLAAQSLAAIFVLEVFNYIAHYGLQRRRQPDGRYEPMRPCFSWNTRRPFTNLALLNGGRHSDHHRAAARPYQHLIDLDGAPELPFGYGGTMLLALVPPLWRRVMDPRLEAVRQAQAQP